MGLFGFAGDLLSKPKVTKNWYDDYIGNVIPTYGADISAQGASNKALVDEYGQLLRTAGATSTAMLPEDLATLTGAIGRQTKVDPLGTYESIRTGNLAALTGLAPMLAGLGKKSVDQSLMNRGVFNQRPGSLEQALRLREVNNAIAPVANNIFSRLGADTGTVEGARGSNLTQLLQLLSARASAPYRDTGVPLQIADAGTGYLERQLGQLAGLGDIAKSNVAGFQVTDRPISTALKNFDAQLERAASQAMSTAGSVASAYFGGGMGGGGGGGTGAQSQPAIPTGPAPSGTTFNWQGGYPVSQAPKPDYSQYYPSWFSGYG